MANILLVEDERELADLISTQLRQDGHSIVVASDGRVGVELWKQEKPDLVILDWMLPELDGPEVCRRIRAESIVPVLMLTARAHEMDRVWGLEVGADDYMSKPFSMQELRARVRAILRRMNMLQQSRAESSVPILDFKFIQIYPDHREVYIEGKKIYLTPKEYELLFLFLSNTDRVFSREYLLEKIWGLTYDGHDRTVDTHVSRIRRKLGSYSHTIQTVWGTGYKFDSLQGKKNKRECDAER